VDAKQLRPLGLILYPPDGYMSVQMQRSERPAFAEANLLRAAPAKYAAADPVRAAWSAVHENVGRSRPDLVLEGVLVEAMSRPGLELVVGATRDPQWGPSS
jgi:acyl-CoA synthetase (NDP forming)